MRTNYNLNYGFKNLQYFAVQAKCGHSGHGKQYYVPIIFPVTAQNAEAAAATVRGMGRVKHHHKDAILQVRRISGEEYIELQLKNSQDPFLSVTSIQEQRIAVDMSDRIYREAEKPVYKKSKEYRQKGNKAYRGKTGKDIVRDTHKYFRYFDDNSYELDYDVS